MLTNSSRALNLLLSAASLFVLCGSVFATDGVFTIPYVTGRPERHPFVGHTGWVDVYRAGYGPSRFARIDAGGKFTLPDPDRPVCLIAMFDKTETPPLIVPRWPVRPGDYEVAIPVEYACVPDGTPKEWDRQYAAKATDFCQSIVARGTQLYGMSLFVGPKFHRLGNKMHLCIHEGGPEQPLMFLNNYRHPDPVWQGNIDRISSGYSTYGVLRAGWRYGNLETVPGKTYTLRAEGYRSHGGNRWQLNAYVRPDKSDGYPDGRAYADNKPLDGDLVCMIFGNSHGQLIENQIAAEDWEIFIPRHRPSTSWGQTFVAHGVSLAGVSFWASAGDTKPVTCEVRIREEGPWGKMLKPVKVATGHESPDRPIIVYPDLPKPLPGYEAWYKLPCQFFQAAWPADEMKLTPGKTYYIELSPSRPLMLYADGNFYKDGYAYYEGLKVDRQAGGQATMHSYRWTLLMNIVTYAKPGGAPLIPATAR